MGIGEIFKSFYDMKKMSDFQKILTQACDELEKEGKLPADVKAFMDKMNNGKADAGQSNTDQVKMIEEGLKLFEQHSDIFGDKIEKTVKEYEAKAADVEKLTEELAQKK